MPSTAYKINDRRGQDRHYSGVANNHLYKAAIQTDERKTIPNLNWDHERNISRLGHRQLRSIGKFLYANFPIIKGALLEQAWLSVAHFIPQFNGEDEAWGEQAEAWLREWEKICLIQSWAHDMCSYRTGLVLGTRREGNHFTLMVDNGEGYPLVQVIPSHRVGNAVEQEEVDGGEYDGYRICNGIIQDDYSRAVAYRVYPDGFLNTEYVDIPAENMFQSFFPEYDDQGVGISSLANAACDWQDVQERREFELLAQKLGSSIALIEKNEAGEALSASDHIVTPEETTDTSATPTGLVIEKFDKGTIRYIRNGESLEALRYDRPSRDSQDFEAAIIRGAFKGMEWDVDFSLDPSKVGGAPMRVVVDKINRTIEKNQALVEKAMRRIHGWAISKAIKLGLLPPNDEWWKWEYQGPPRITADAKYDDDIDRERLKMGGMTYRDWYAKRGMWWKDEIRQRIKEQKFIEVECKNEGVDVNKVQLLTPNGNLQSGQQEKEESNETTRNTQDS